MRRSTTRSDGPAPSVAQAAAWLGSEASSSEELVLEALARARDPAGEGQRVFTRRYDDRAVEEARGWDRLRRAGFTPTPLAGLPVSIKDLFDVAGEPTTAGSRVLGDSAPATADAEVVARLRRAGAVIVGKTNMTEFAYSGLGINPHFGTPRNPFARGRGLIPGGSSSGAVVSVTDGMAIAAIGTDTGGSVRIPAALCGIVGFKPTAARISRAGVLPLSRTLDSIGPLARTVECCAVLDAIMAGSPLEPPDPVPVAGLRVGVARTLVWNDTEPHVASSVEEALRSLAGAGAHLTELPFTELADIPAVIATGGFSAPESYAWHRQLLARRRDEYDPRIAARIEQGMRFSAADYLDLVDARRRIQSSAARAIADVDVWVMPTVPRTAPEIEALSADDAYAAANRLMLRNPALVNFLDGCAISLPCHAPGDAPVGLSLVARSGEDRRLLAIARSVAQLLTSDRAA